MQPIPASHCPHSGGNDFDTWSVEVTKLSKLGVLVAMNVVLPSTLSPSTLIQSLLWPLPCRVRLCFDIRYAPLCTVCHVWPGQSGNCIAKLGAQEEWAVDDAGIYLDHAIKVQLFPGSCTCAGFCGATHTNRPLVGIELWQRAIGLSGMLCAMSACCFFYQTAHV